MIIGIRSVRVGITVEIFDGKENIKAPASKELSAFRSVLEKLLESAGEDFWPETSKTGPLPEMFLEKFPE